MNDSLLAVICTPSIGVEVPIALWTCPSLSLFSKISVDSNCRHQARLVSEAKKKKGRCVIDALRLQCFTAMGIHRLVGLLSFRGVSQSQALHSLAMLLQIVASAAAFKSSSPKVRLASGSSSIVVRWNRIRGTPIASDPPSLKFSDAFSALDLGLTEGQHLWRPEPFYNPSVEWRKAEPRLYRDLLRLSNEEVAQLYQNTRSLHEWMCKRIPSFRTLAHVSEMLDESAAARQELCGQPANNTSAQQAGIGIPGKKWEQVEGFAAVMPKRQQPAVEWCSGKGFLSQRMLSHGVASSSVCLEMDTSLCDRGSQIAVKANLPMTFEEINVLEQRSLPSYVRALSPSVTHVALHACGGLHRRMLQCAVKEMKAVDIAVAPCCYHKYSSGEVLKPLSNLALQSSLRLTNTDLQLPNNGQRPGYSQGRLLMQEAVWRKSFTAWHSRVMRRRAMSGDRSIVSAAMQNFVKGKRIDWTSTSILPSMPRKLFRECISQAASLAGFHSFCRWGASIVGDNEVVRDILMSAVDDWNGHEALLCCEIGAAQMGRVHRLDLVRYAYRRPLEQWLVLDLCLFLEEQGYHADLVQFCKQDVSPRNLMVLGHRS